MQEYSDIIGSIGVFILLLAFALNLLDKIKTGELSYIILNILGAGLACYASYLIKYTPFIVLEAVWTLVSVTALIKYYKRS
jgi:hypothetical protein